ncbi:MarR family winged helix-turn-helix transcriptional regulator [Bombilactobacillus bombi]|uniref:MarR family winged helix-turn-helix transcriptional regulator n=1 Tax=Bombilactobacillus bombi TaxID=1303590 RepID=UPI0015E5DCF2|nr:MarR family transcriptional regulator [Bombilactobacillus bombi]MBA1435218.1 MarR family transcriptional regulator [Bombilactobacillus bombi]
MVETKVMDMPTRDYLKKLKSQYSDIDIDSIVIVLEYLNTGRDLTKLYAQFFEKFNLTESKFLVLMLLYRENNHSLLPSQIAQKAGITRATVTTLLDGLVSMGLVLRYPDESDRRRLIIKLSNKGEKNASEILPLHYKLTSLITSFLSVDESRKILLFINKIKKGMDLYSKEIKKKNKEGI